MRFNGARLVGAIIAISLLAAACGSGRSDTSAADAAPDTTTGVEASSTFGTLPSPCGPAEQGAPNPASGEQGVTGDSVTIGYGDDAGYQPSPGLNAEMSEAVEAMIKWCNDQGGINGRTVKGIYYDAAILNAPNVMAEACVQVFMLVGQGWALDGGAEETRVGCKLPQVSGYSVSAVVAHGPWSYTGVPNPVDYVPTAAADLLAQEHPGEVKKAAILYPDFAATIETADKVKAAYPQWGWNFVGDCEQTYPIAGVAQWAPYVQKLKDCGAEVVYFIGSPLPELQNMLDAAKQAGFDPLYLTDSSFYVQEFANGNASGNGNKLFVEVPLTPFEQADSNPATRQYVDMVGAQGDEPAFLGVQAASAFLLWATAAKACGADLTRDCVLGHLAETTSWTAGGLHTEGDPGGNVPPACQMVLNLQGTTFVQAMPSTRGEFACDPRYASKVEGIPAIAAAHLDESRKSTLHTGG